MQNLRQSLGTFTYEHTQPHTHKHTCIYKTRQFYPVYIVHIYTDRFYIDAYAHIFIQRESVY